MKKIILISMILWAAGSLYSQESAGQHSWRSNLGVGISGFGGAGCMSRGVGFSFRDGSDLFTCRYINHNEIEISGDAWVRGNDFAVLYGTSDHSKYSFNSASIGISYLGGLRRGRSLGSSGGWFTSTKIYEKISFHTIGVPIEVEVFWTPTPGFGLGFRGFANLNNKAPYAGALFCLEFKTN